MLTVASPWFDGTASRNPAIRSPDTIQLARAFSYARRGWHVFPCHPGGKKPLGVLVPHGLNDATRDEATIGAWWTAAPDANIGINTGRSALFVVDIDRQHEGVATWATLIADHGAPRTATVLTPGGGRHLYFNLPVGGHIRNDQGERLGPGIDIRGIGGYVVAAGSERPEGTYRWAESSVVADAPAWLVGLATANPPRGATSRPAPVDTSPSDIPGGRRNSTLTSLAGGMRRRGMTPAAVEAALLAENTARCNPPLPADEVSAIAASICRYAPGESPGGATSGPTAGAAVVLPFRTAVVLANEQPAAPAWIVPGFVAPGVVSEFVGKLKASGKTTFIAWMVRSVTAAADFLGRPTRRTAVLWLTEERPTSFLETLKRAGLTASDDLHILFWHDVRHLSWPAVVAAAADHAVTVGAGVLIVDTVSQFAGLRGDAENNSGDALAAVEPLQAAAAQRLAIIASRHERKGGGEVGESGRGSSAFSGAVDIVVAIRRGEGQTKPTVRVLHTLSRFSETPDTLVIDLTERGYVALGTEGTVAVLEAERAILDRLPILPSLGDRVPAEPDYEAALPLEAALENQQPRIARTVAQEALRRLEAAGVVGKLGKGKKGAPHRWFRTGEPSCRNSDHVVRQKSDE